MCQFKYIGHTGQYQKEYYFEIDRTSGAFKANGPLSHLYKERKGWLLQKESIQESSLLAHLCIARVLLSACTRGDVAAAGCVQAQPQQLPQIRTIKRN